MTAANDSIIGRAILARIVPLTVAVVWGCTVVFALAAARGLGW